MKSVPGRAPCLPAERSRVDELERALRLLRSGAGFAGIADALSRRLTNKLLHAPTKAIQRWSRNRALS